MFWRAFLRRVEIWLMMRQKHSLKLQTKMETERLVLMVSEKKQRKIILNFKKNLSEGEKYNHDKNMLKLNFLSSMYTSDVYIRFQ